MSESLPKCSLCGSEPCKSYAGYLLHDNATECPLDDAKLTEDQWRTLHDQSRFSELEARIDELEAALSQKSYLLDGLRERWLEERAAWEAESAALRADAERYRYIRSNQVWHRFDEYSVVGAKFDYADDFQAAVMLDHHIDRRLSLQPAQSDLKCWMCERTDGELREQSDGGGYESSTLVCADCFTPQDTGPTFDDLPVAQSEGE